MKDTFDKFHERDDRGRFGDEEFRPSRPRVTGASDLVDLELVIHAGTEKALLVSSDGNEERVVWLARSLIEIEHKQATVAGVKRNGQMVQLGTCTVTMPQWLANKNGLI